MSCSRFTLVIVIRSFRRGPLFMLAAARTYLTRADITTLLHHSLPQSVIFNTHSFLHWLQSVLPTVFQVMGRWRSDTYTRYVTFSDEFIIHANCLMACTDVDRESGLSNFSGSFGAVNEFKHLQLPLQIN